jgi:DNA-directed RNA polymerase specialized sigma24 family protein
VCPRQTGWTLTAEAFDALLGSLSADPREAAQRYEHLRTALVRFFEWRGGRAPEEQTDDVLDRAARKVRAGEPIADITGFCHGIARLVLLEGFKERVHEPLDDRVASSAALETADADHERQLACLDRCMGGLAAAEREFALEYHRPRGAEKVLVHQSLAARLGLAPAALRVRAHRLRVKLEACVLSCVNEHPPSVKHFGGGHHINERT